MTRDIVSVINVVWNQATFAHTPVGISTLVIKRLIPLDTRRTNHGWMIVVQHRRVRYEGDNSWICEWKGVGDHDWQYKSRGPAVAKGTTGAKKWLGIE